MNTPMNMPPISLTDIVALLETNTDKALARVDEALSRHNEDATKRDAALRADISRLREEMKERDAKLAERDAKLAERDTEAAARETRLVKWFGSVVGVAVGLLALVIVAVSIGFGVWIELRAAPSMPPITVDIPPPVVYAIPPGATPLAVSPTAGDAAGAAQR